MLAKSPRSALPIAVLVALVVALASLTVSSANASGHSRASQTRAKVAGPADRAAGPDLFLAMNGKKSRRGVGVKGLKNSGRAKVSVKVVARDGGKAHLVRGRSTRRAVRLPSFSSKSAPPKAEVRVAPAGRRGNPLDPGTRDFTFGADFLLNSGTSDTGKTDDGDNLMQRGQFNSKSQYKIQLDGSRANCRVKGSTDAVEVTSRVLTRNRWYRVRCTRTDETVSLRVWKLKKHGVTLMVNLSQTSTTGIGTVTLPRTRDMAIGGRLSNHNTVPHGHADQFNGIVDQVMYDRI